METHRTDAPIRKDDAQFFHSDESMSAPSYKAKRLARMLNDQLEKHYGNKEYTVAPDEIYPVTGWYRTSKYADVQRWEATVRWTQFGGANGPLGSIGSWDTMTDCIQFGVELRRDPFRAHEFDAMSRNSINYPPSQRPTSTRGAKA